jgi:hypothetical protein
LPEDTSLLHAVPSRCERRIERVGLRLPGRHHCVEPAGQVCPRRAIVITPDESHPDDL